VQGKLLQEVPPTRSIRHARHDTGYEAKLVLLLLLLLLLYY
jgi:hypothetical protein